jgi:hypothetical protein
MSTEKLIKHASLQSMEIKPSGRSTDYLHKTILIVTYFKTKTMADISKCKGTDCPVKEVCYRYTAPEGMMQAYFTEVPGKLENNEFSCSKYWGKSAQNIYEQSNHIVKGEGK